MTSGDQPDFSKGAMIALYPPAGLARQLHTDGGFDVDELHCTVAYLGDAADVDLDKVLTAAEAIAERPAITGSVAGHGRFTGGEQDVLVALVDSPALEQLRRDLVDALSKLNIEVPAEHGYTPHVTLQYLDRGDLSPVDRLEAPPVTFGALVVVHGTDRYECPFWPADIATAAREAFAAGWAASGGPFTERVRAAGRVAVELACERADDPDILEATLQLGSLEGTWAAVYDRREKLYTEHIAAVMTVWRKLVDRLDIGAAVRRFRSQLGLAEDDQDDRRRRDAALVAAGWLLNQLLDYNQAPEDDDKDTTPAAPAQKKRHNYLLIIAAIATAIMAGEAEGVAGALALAADQAGVPAFNWDTAYADAYTALGDTTEFESVALATFRQILDAAAKDLGRTLADLAEQGASYDEMLAAAKELLAGKDIRAIRLLIDYAMGKAFSRAQLAFYRAQGVTQAWWITAGDERVCQVCQDIEDANPWFLNDIPEPPKHYLCRCSIYTEEPIKVNLGRYTTEGD